MDGDESVFILQFISFHQEGEQSGDGTSIVPSVVWTPLLETEGLAQARQVVGSQTGQESANDPQGAVGAQGEGAGPHSAHSLGYASKIESRVVGDELAFGQMRAQEPLVSVEGLGSIPRVECVIREVENGLGRLAALVEANDGNLAQAVPRG